MAWWYCRNKKASLRYAVTSHTGKMVGERLNVKVLFQDEETDMRCVICKEGDTAPGKVTVTLQRGNTVVIVREAPAAVCQNCDEYYLDEAVASKLYRQGEEAVRRNAEVEILRYAA